MISVLIPTITGREEMLAGIIEAFATTTPDDLEVVVEVDHATCAEGWNAAYARCHGDYIFYGADDLEPVPGWAEAMVACLDRGELPASQVWNNTLDGPCANGQHDGPPGSLTLFSRTPALTRAMAELIGPHPPLHYYSDNWVSAAARHHGFPCRVTDGFSFIHHWHPHGRLDDGDWHGRWWPLYQQELLKLERVPA